MLDYTVMATLRFEDTGTWRVEWDNTLKNHRWKSLSLVTIKKKKARFFPARTIRGTHNKYLFFTGRIGLIKLHPSADCVRKSKKQFFPFWANR